VNQERRNQIKLEKEKQEAERRLKERNEERDRLRAEGLIVRSKSRQFGGRSKIERVARDPYDPRLPAVATIAKVIKENYMATNGSNNSNGSRDNGQRDQGNIGRSRGAGVSAIGHEVHQSDLPAEIRNLPSVPDGRGPSHRGMNPLKRVAEQQLREEGQIHRSTFDKAAAMTNMTRSAFDKAFSRRMGTAPRNDNMQRGQEPSPRGSGQDMPKDQPRSTSQMDAPTQEARVIPRSISKVLDKITPGFMRTRKDEDR
jgi:hypothetical protein